MSHATVIDVVTSLAGHTDRGVHLLDRRGRKTGSRSYADLVRRAQGHADWYRGRGLADGARVGLCLPTSFELIEAFFGAVLAGLEPTIIGLPRSLGGEQAFRRRIALLRSGLDLSHLLTLDWVGALLAPGDLPMDVPPPIRARPLDGHDPTGGDAERTCHLQLTSGSTAVPKVVVVSHRAVIANIRAMHEHCGIVDGHAFANWLPLHHDMGLIGSLLCACYAAGDLYLLRPDTFLVRPNLWLELISAHGVRCAHSPNFGFRQLVERVTKAMAAGLDLASWDVCAIGAEQVREPTMEAVIGLLESAGLQRRTLTPGYGMAELTLGITSGHDEGWPRFAEFSAAQLGRSGGPRRLACLGPVIDGIELELVDAARNKLSGDDVEGELRLRGTSLCSGYTDAAATAAAIDADGWFYSGDLGLMRDGELYLSGRAKDLLILAGQNIAPDELEWLAQQRIGDVDSRAGAFSVDAGDGEAPVLVAEVDPRDGVDLAALAAEIRDAVAREYAPLAELVLVRRGALPLTSSGKVRRSHLREQYLAGLLPALHAERLRLS